METPTSPGLDSASVAITVSPLVPVSGKGDIKYTASVRLSINDVEIELAGWTLRQDKAGKMRCFRPAYRDFRTGEWQSCVTLPPSRATRKTRPGRPGRSHSKGGMDHLTACPAPRDVTRVTSDVGGKDEVDTGDGWHGYQRKEVTERWTRLQRPPSRSGGPAKRTMKPAGADEIVRAAHDRHPSSSSSALASLRSLVPKPSVNQA